MNLADALTGNFGNQYDGNAPLPDAEDEKHVMGLNESVRSWARVLWHRANSSPATWRKREKYSHAMAQVEIARQQSMRKMEDMKIPQGFLALVKNDLIVTRLQDRELDAAVEKKCLIAVLHGAVDTGKTTSACRRLSRQVYGQYIQAALLLSLSIDFSDDRERLMALQNTPFLVVDDLGRGFESSKHQLRFEEILCTRFDNERPTLCTTNKTREEFILDYGPRVERRAVDFNRSAFIECRAEGVV
jgi:DNA replication protein DnaC